MILSVDPAEISVDIGFPCGANVPWYTCMSLAKTVKACTEKRIQIGMACIAGSSVVTWARTKVVDTFLAGEAKYLFFVDSDMVWEPQDFIKLLALSTQYGVVCGAYAQKTDAQTIVIRHDDLLTFDLNPHGLVKVKGAGLGFVVIPRTILQELANTKPLVFDPVEQRGIRDVFRTDTVDRGHAHPDVRHEDIAFFADIIELGHDVWLDPTIRLGHVGQKVYHSDPLEALRLTEAFRQHATT